MGKEKSIFDKYDFDHDWNDKTILKKPKPATGGKKTTKTSFLKHTVKDNRKNV